MAFTGGGWASVPACCFSRSPATPKRSDGWRGQPTRSSRRARSACCSPRSAPSPRSGRGAGCRSRGCWWQSRCSARSPRWCCPWSLRSTAWHAVLPCAASCFIPPCRSFSSPATGSSGRALMRLRRLARRRAVMAALVGLLIAAHLVLLQRMHARWRAAGEVFDGVTQSFVAAARIHDPGRDGLMFLLSLPDNVRGAYVFRRGFYARLHFLAPDLAARSASILAVESQTLRAPGDTVVARRQSRLEVCLDV